MLRYHIPKVEGIMVIPTQSEYLYKRAQEVVARRFFLRDFIRYKELRSYSIKIDEQGKLSFIAEPREERTLEEMEKIPDVILRELPEFAAYLYDSRPIREQLKDTLHYQLRPSQVKAMYENIPDEVLREIPEFAEFLKDSRPIKVQVKDPGNPSKVKAILEKIPDATLRGLLKKCPEFVEFLSDPRPIKDLAEDFRPIVKQIKKPLNPNDRVKTIKDLLRAGEPHIDITNIPESPTESQSLAYVWAYKPETREFKLRIGRVHHFGCLKPAIFGREKFDDEFAMFKEEEAFLAGNIFAREFAMLAFNDGSGSHNLNLYVINYLLDPEKYIKGGNMPPSQEEIETFMNHFGITYAQFQKVDKETQQNFLLTIKSEYEQSIEKGCKIFHFPFSFFVQYVKYKENCKKDPGCYFTAAVALSKSTPIEKKVMPPLPMDSSKLAPIVENNTDDSFPVDARKSPRKSVTLDEISPTGFKVLQATSEFIQQRNSLSGHADTTSGTTSGIIRKLSGSPEQTDASVPVLTATPLVPGDIEEFRKKHAPQIEQYQAEAKRLSDEHRRRQVPQAKGDTIGTESEGPIVPSLIVHGEPKDQELKLEDKNEKSEGSLIISKRSPLVSAKEIHDPNLEKAPEHSDESDVESSSESESQAEIRLPQNAGYNICSNMFTMFNRIDCRVVGAVALGATVLGVGALLF